jgi:hypothetical protein
MLGPVPKKMLNPREVACQVDGEMFYVGGLAHGRTYVTPPKSERAEPDEPNPNLERQVDNLVPTVFALSSAIGFVAAYLTIGSAADMYSARPHIDKTVLAMEVRFIYSLS